MNNQLGIQENEVSLELSESFPKQYDQNNMNINGSHKKRHSPCFKIRIEELDIFSSNLPNIGALPKIRDSLPGAIQIGVKCLESITCSL